MNEFRTYNPIVAFMYFVLVIGFSMVFMHPVCLIISAVCSLSYSILLKGKRAIKFNLLYMLPLIVVSALMNPVFNHQGITVITYLPGGNPLTLESILYGISAAVMIFSVISWFSCFNIIMTSDKLMYLFGKIIPSLSLIFSMVLRFVPKFNEQIKSVTKAQKCIGRDISSGSIIQRAKNGIKILSIMITRCLEEAIDTSDSMRSRGYGLPKRTSYSNYSFSKRDTIVIGCILILAVYILINAIWGQMSFEYYPSVMMGEINLQRLSVFAAYFLLCILPIIIEIKEACRWKSLKSKI